MAFHPPELISLVFLPTWVDFWAFLPTWINFCMILPTWVNFWAFFPTWVDFAEHFTFLSWFLSILYPPELISGHFFQPEFISEHFLPTWVDFWEVFLPTWVDFWPPEDPGNEALYLGGHPHPHRIHLQPHLDGFTKMADDGRSLKTPQWSHFFLKHARIYLVLSIFVGINWKTYL